MNTDSTSAIADARAAQITAYGAPNTEDMARINAIARTPLTPDDIFVARTIASHDGLDSYSTHMDAGTSLTNFVRDVKGRTGVPILYGHMKGLGVLPMGRAFTGALHTGEVVGAADAKHYMTADFYLPRHMGTANGNTDDVIRAIETGAVTDSSVGFGGKYKYHCDVCGDPDMLRSTACSHWPGMPVYVEGKRTERIATAGIFDAALKELSPVWRGSAPGAEMVGRMEALLAKGAVSRADIEELDGATGQRLAEAIDWAGLRQDRRYFQMPPESKREDKTDEQTEDKGALGGALDLLNTPPPAPKDSDKPTPRETVQTGKAPATTKDAGEKPEGFTLPASRLAALSIASEADFDRLVAEAEDGRNYRAELIDLCHKTGIRAAGESYNREIHERMLAHLDTKDLRAELTSRTTLARELFRKDDPATEDAARNKLTQPVGGRQTVPTEGALGDRGKPAALSSTQEDKDDALFAVARPKAR